MIVHPLHFSRSVLVISTANISLQPRLSSQKSITCATVVRGETIIHLLISPSLRPGLDELSVSVSDILPGKVISSASLLLAAPQLRSTPAIALLSFPNVVPVNFQNYLFSMAQKGNIH